MIAGAERPDQTPRDAALRVLAPTGPAEAHDPPELESWENIDKPL